jgi:hypothetical protein
MQSLKNTRPTRTRWLALALVACATGGPASVHAEKQPIAVKAVDVTDPHDVGRIAVGSRHVGLTIASAVRAREQETDAKVADSSQEAQSNGVVGVWEEVAPAEVDCQTRQPVGPTIRALLTFNQGGTMYVEDTFPMTGPYRTTGGGVWTRTSARHYTYGNLHYEFDPDKTFLLTIKQRSELTLSRDGNSFTENGTFQGIDPTGNVLFEGCFAARATRPQF